MHEFLVFDDPDAVAAEAARRFAEAAADAVAGRGAFFAALSGGSTPERLYRRLADPKVQIPWNASHLFFSDERHVPLEAPESNFALARRTLLDHVPAHDFPAPVAFDTAGEVADAYAAQIVAQLGPDPRFDLVLLGMGEDGHTASLFPGRPALHATGWVAASAPGVLPPPVDRITFTFPLINRARRVLVLVTGVAKREPLARWRRGEGALDDLPVVGLSPTDGILTVLADRAAAGEA